ncbi:hypothetical protein ACT7DC_29815 [Bacillus cereus]
MPILMMYQSFLSEQHSKAFESINSTKNENIHPITAVTIDVNATVMWDGIVWRIVNVGFQSISLYSDENGLLELPKIHFIELLNNGRIELKK